jgi:hypothetical protein
VPNSLFGRLASGQTAASLHLTTRARITVDRYDPSTHQDWRPQGCQEITSQAREGEAALRGQSANSKGYGDGAVQAYIAAIPGWKRELGRRIDALVVRTVPGVQKAVKWNSPFYGIEGQGWFLSFHCFTKYIKVTFFRGRSLSPVPPGEVQTSGSALPGRLRGSAGRVSTRRLGEAGQQVAGEKM